MLLRSRYSIPGFWTRDSSYLHHVDSVASSFRIIVTFAIVLEVHGIFFFQIPWTTYGRSSSLNWNITTGLFLRSSPFINRDSASSTFLHGLSRRNMLNLVRHINLCIHNSKRYMSPWVVPLHLYSDHRLSIDSQEYACVRLSMPITLVVRQAILSRND